MKRFTRNKIVLIIILVAVALLVLLVRTCKRYECETEMQVPAIVGNGKDNPSDITDAKKKQWMEQYRRDPYFLLRMPITFYGKVVDDRDGTPIAGASVGFRWSNMSPDRSSTSEMVADEQGKFTISGIKGGSLSVYPGKKGYYPVMKGIQNRFEYGVYFDPNFHHPDPRNPVIFKLHKAHGTAEGLLVRRGRFGIPFGGEAVPITLRTADKGVPADITISMTRDEQIVNNRQNWSATIAGANGARLVESDSEFMFKAPEEGYVGQYHYEFKANEPNCPYVVEKKYYVCSGDGKTYARIEVEFNAAGANSGRAIIAFYINPTGSKNLESQPGMNLRLPNTLQTAR